MKQKEIRFHMIQDVKFTGRKKIYIFDRFFSFFFLKKKNFKHFFFFFFSVGALLWEIAELKKPHSDFGSDLLANIRKRVKENYELPFLEDVPNEWKSVVSRGIGVNVQFFFNFNVK